MPHPTSGGSGNRIDSIKKLSFKQAFTSIDTKGTKFKSTTGEKITATQSFARDGRTPTIVFSKDGVTQGNVCVNCWGYRQSCTGTWIGQYAEGLGKHIKP